MPPGAGFMSKNITTEPSASTNNSQTSDGELKMGENGSSGIPTREAAGQTSALSIEHDQQFPQGPTNEKTHLSNSPSRLGLSDTKDYNLMDSLPPETNFDSLGTQYPTADQELVDTGSQPDVTAVAPNLEGRVGAHFQGIFKSYQELTAALQLYERDAQEMKNSISRMAEDVSLLQRENEKLSERMTKAEQVAELQDTLSEIQTNIGQFRQDVSKLPSFRDELLDSEIGRAFGGLYRDKLALSEELRKYHEHLESATEEINFKRSESEQLKEAIVERDGIIIKLEQKLEKIQKQLCNERAGQHGSYVDGQQTPFLLESTAKDMFTSIATFSSLLSKYTDTTGYNAAHSFIMKCLCKTGVKIARERHWTYGLKEFICSHLFENFQSETFPDSSNALMFLRQEERVSTCFEYFQNRKDKEAWEKTVCHASKVDFGSRFDYLFFQYFVSKASNLLPGDFKHPLLEAFREVRRNNDESVGIRLRDLFLSRLAPDQQRLVDGLLIAVRKVWQFHKLCLSFEPPATIFRVSRGDLFNEDYMESIDVQENAGELSATPKVAFMTYPGFRLRKSIIKCEVYLEV